MVKIRLENILWGGEQGIPAAAYSVKSQNYLRSSTPLAQSPHVKLLSLYQREGEKLFEAKLYEKTDYYRNLCECIRLCGNYFDITDPRNAENQVRRFIDHYKGEESAPVYHQSAHGNPLVAKNAFSRFYEVIDGMHRLAIEYVKGTEEVECRVSETETMTCLQELVLGNQWTLGQKLLYQPILLPEFEAFTLVRKCSDRFEMMKNFIALQGWELQDKPFLDLGCSYGYFLNKMETLGMRAYGVDSCPNSITLARIYYGQPKSRLQCLSLENFFALNSEKYEVVSLLSVLHHFLLHRGKISAEELIKEVDQITARCLFLDSGQNHEAWFKDSLPDWDEKKLINWLREKTTFDEVVCLGKDEDSVGVYAPNYGRSLIACFRK